MPKKRQSNKHLPPRVYHKHGAYYFVTKSNQWINLGKELGKAVAKWAEIVERPVHISTMNDLLDRYLLEVIPTKADKTALDQRHQLVRLKNVFGHMQPSDIRPIDIYGYLDLRPPVAGNREKSLLSHVFTKGIRWGVVEKNPCKDVVRNTEKPRDRYVTDAEFDEFLKLVPPYIQLAMEISRMTGLRQGDILRLKQSNITPDGLLVKQGKTGKKMLFELTDELSTLLVRRYTRVTSIDRHLLLNSRGQPLTSSGFKTMWQRRMKVFRGDRFTFHDIRAKAGSEVENTHELLGNSEAVARKHYQRKLKPITPNR